MGGADVLARLRAVDTDLKRGAFVITGGYALAFLAGAVLFAVTGEPALMAVAAALYGATVAIVVVGAALWKTATRLFPDRKEN